MHDLLKTLGDLLDDDLSYRRAIGNAMRDMSSQIGKV